MPDTDTPNLRDIMDRANEADSLGISPSAQLNQAVTGNRVANALSNHTLDLIELQELDLRARMKSIEHRQSLLDRERADCNHAIKSMEAARKSLMGEE